MATKPQPLKGGNVSIRNAINQRTEALWRHGVNPAGMPGWSETADGWKPPLSFGGGVFDSFVPWSLTVVPPAQDNLFSILRGTILINPSSVFSQFAGAEPNTLTCSNEDFEFTPAAGLFIAIKLESLNPTTYELVELNTWPEEDGFTMTYTGTPGEEGFEFVAKHYPLWYFIDTKPDQSWTGFGESIFGKQVCPPFNFKMVDTLYKTKDGEYLVAPDFDIAHIALTV